MTMKNENGLSHPNVLLLLDSRSISRDLSLCAPSHRIFYISVSAGDTANHSHRGTSVSHTTVDTDGLGCQRMTRKAGCGSGLSLLLLRASYQMRVCMCLCLRLLVICILHGICM